MELTNINGTVIPRFSCAVPDFAHSRTSRWRRGKGCREGLVLRMIVLMLAMRLMIFALTLASGPVPKAGSYDAGERLTAKGVSFGLR